MQLTTEIGPIDILALSQNQTPSSLSSSRRAVRPIKWLVKFFVTWAWVKGQLVKGLVVCRDRDDKLLYALDTANDLDLRYYSVSFKLTEVPQPEPHG